jgi:hypothetical protein
VNVEARDAQSGVEHREVRVRALDVRLWRGGPCAGCEAKREDGDAGGGESDPWSHSYVNVRAPAT